jgi:hypothetical protein
MPKIIEAHPLEDKKIFIKYSDGLEGELSLKKLLAREEYKRFKNKDLKTALRIDEESGDVIVFDTIKLCKVAMHEMLRLKKQMEKVGIYLGDG